MDLNFVILQYWEISDEKLGIQPNGCSLHIDISDHDKYVKELYHNRVDIKDVPSSYDRKVSGHIIVSVSDDLCARLMSGGTLKLRETEMNNLIALEDIIVC